MTHSTSNYQSNPVHPTEGYAGPDLAVAFLANAKGETTARTVCWPEKKLYQGIYGTQSSKLGALLHSMGYKRGLLTGARMEPIHMKGSPTKTTVNLIVPYTDGDRYVHYTGEYVIWGEDPKGKHEARGTSTSGIISFHHYISEFTGEIIPAGDVTEIRHPQDGRPVYCSRSERSLCSNHNGNRHLPDSGEWAQYYTPVGYSGTQRVPLYYANNYLHQCLETKKFFNPGDGITVRDGFVCFEAFLNKYAVDEFTGVADLRSRMVWMEHQAWWNSRTFETHGVVGPDGKNYAKHLLEPSKEVA